ncbi:MAG: addiction module protein [Candidatus Paceibacterota bacterium]
MSAEKVLADALQLSDRDRANIAVSLIDSLDPAIDSDWEVAWDQEIARRTKELDEGSVETVPWSVVRQNLQGRLNGRPTS